METLEQMRRNVADLHWLATLLTGCRETATEVTFQALGPADNADTFFSNWMLAWSRRNVIARALAAVREDLARSARHLATVPFTDRGLPSPSWTLERITRSELEQALVSIAVFPRAAVLLLAFERVPLKDAAILLDAEPDLVRAGMAAGARELTINLARMQSWHSAVLGSDEDWEGDRVRSTIGS